MAAVARGTAITASTGVTTTTGRDTLLATALQASRPIARPRTAPTVAPHNASTSTCTAIVLRSWWLENPNTLSRREVALAPAHGDEGGMGHRDDRDDAEEDRQQPREVLHGAEPSDLVGRRREPHLDRVGGAYSLTAVMASTPSAAVTTKLREHATLSVAAAVEADRIGGRSAHGQPRRARAAIDADG